MLWVSSLRDHTMTVTAMLWRMDLLMSPLGVVLGAVLVAALIAFPFTLGRRYFGRYFIGRDLRRIEGQAREAWLGGTVDGYVPHGDLGPSPRERLTSPPDADD